MSQPFRQSLDRHFNHIAAEDFADSLIGVEKESLRTTAAGKLAHTPHPQLLGSALTHSAITTDFSEALLEFVTPAAKDYWQVHQYLCDLHTYTYRHINDELLWVTSMPCLIGTDADIPLARYGASNVGQMKTVYRRGLGLRYGRPMQTISGLHFNFSVAEAAYKSLHSASAGGQALGDFKSERYLGLIRNFRRIGWLILYLFGASPAVCKSFIDDPYTALPEFDRDTLFGPYATSLRMSDLGYSNKNQSRLQISLNDLTQYVDNLSAAISTPEAEYEALGVKVDGRYLQLNANVLQIENEYYSPMRPKRVARSGERPTTALSRGGIEYVELRSLDLNPFEPVGISQRQARFVETLLLYCWMHDSPPMAEQDLAVAQSNDALTARGGRDPALLLQRGDQSCSLKDWAAEILGNLAQLAAKLDGDQAGDFSAAIDHYQALVQDPDLTPSAQMLEIMSAEQQSFFEFALARSASNRRYFESLEAINEARMADLATEAVASHARQKEIESKDSTSFDEYLRNYFAVSSA